jgi:hypothetical protein
MKQFRFRALINLDPPPAALDKRCYPSGTRELLHSGRLDAPRDGKYLRAMISADGDAPLEAGRTIVATITVTDDEALSYLGPGQTFTLWGKGRGRGVISRRVFTSQGPC